MHLFFPNPEFIETLEKLCDEYVKKGKNKIRKEKIKQLIGSLEKIKQYVNMAVLCSNKRLKEGTDSRNIKNTQYTTVYLDGEIWENTETKLFQNNPFLEKVILGKSVKTVNENTFVNCAKLSKIEVKCTTLTVEEGAFSNCPKLNKENITGNTTCKNALIERLNQAK